MWLMPGHSATEVVVSCSCLVLASARLLYFRSVLFHHSPISCAVRNLCELSLNENYNRKSQCFIFIHFMSFSVRLAIISNGDIHILKPYFKMLIY